MRRTGLFADGVLPPSVLPGLSFPSFPSPQAAQAIALLAQLDASQWWPADRVLERQLVQLDALVRHAARTTARGQALYGGLPRPLTWEAWRRVPVLPRTTLQRQPDTLRSRAVPREHGPVETTHSSGSTSTPIAVDRTAVSGIVWHALNVRDHVWHGRDGTAALATVRYAPAAPAPHGLTTPGWGPVMAALGLTGPCHTLHIGATTREQLAWLVARDPAYVLLYPSSLRDLLELAPTRPFPGLRAVLTFGEVVDPDLRDALAARWGVPLQDAYSSQEVGYIALQCPDHPHLHVQSESVFTEIVRDDGTSCAVGERGRVLVTPLHGFAMPLVRYEVGDFAVPGPPCPCGRGLPVIQEVVGRVHQTFVTASGERIWLTIGVHLLPTLGPVAQHQLVQHSPGTLEARLVPHRPPNPTETDALHAHILGRLPAGTSLTITWVDRLERTAHGKFLSFVSRLPTR